MPFGTERLHVVIAGHVDHGKSTVLGRLLADTGSLPDGRIDQVRANCARAGRAFEYAYLADALRDEQAQGITMDTARAFLRTEHRHYLIHDAPGHAELLRNMITGAARAEAAVLVVDAVEGMRESSRRHARMLSLLGVSQLSIAVNKMDKVAWSRERFGFLVNECRRYLCRLGLSATAYVPMSARDGDNVVHRSTRLSWYGGSTLAQAMDNFASPSALEGAPLRIPVQGVYDGAHAESASIVAGMVESGVLTAGDDLVVYPAGVRARVRRIEAFHRPSVESASEGESVGFSTVLPLTVKRGDIVTRARDKPPVVASQIKASVFWLGSVPLRIGGSYVLRSGTARTTATLAQIHSSVDASDLELVSNASDISANHVAECTLQLEPPIALDTVSTCAATGRFVILDDGAIRGGGVVRVARGVGE
jgi:bifunctional enzyme CysN/CysC